MDAVAPVVEACVEGVPDNGDMSAAFRFVAEAYAFALS